MAKYYRTISKPCMANGLNFVGKEAFDFKPWEHALLCTLLKQSSTGKLIGVQTLLVVYVWDSRDITMVIDITKLKREKNFVPAIDNGEKLIDRQKTLPSWIAKLSKARLTSPVNGAINWDAND